MAHSRLDSKRFQERVSPANQNSVVFQSHYATYKFASQFVSEKSVLDLGCGMGYGTALLSDKGGLCIGVDSSCEAIVYGRKNYKNCNLFFSVMRTETLGFISESFDVACSFQVIEHIKDYELYLAEASRVLKTKGLFILSTPNKDLSSPNQAMPLNEHHFKEFTFSELKSLLEKYFLSVEIFGQNLTKETGDLLTKDKRKGRLAKIDFFNLRKIMPSWLRRIVAKLFGVLIEEQINHRDFLISKDMLMNCENIVAVCRDKR